LAGDRVYRATVRAGRGKATGVMATPEAVGLMQQLTGLPVVPGTLNIRMEQPFERDELAYFRLADVGVELDLAGMGIEFEGEQGFHYGRVLVEGQYPAALLLFTWNPDTTNGELVSPHHLRTVLGLEDGDGFAFEFGTGETATAVSGV
jgi:CTP-dependent riboflavin kinase